MSNYVITEPLEVGQKWHTLPENVTLKNIFRVWTLFDEDLFNEFGFKHLTGGVFLEEKIHDYQLRELDGRVQIKYYSRVTQCSPLAIQLR